MTRARVAKPKAHKVAMNPFDPNPPSSSIIVSGPKKTKLPKLSTEKATALAAKNVTTSPVQVKCCHSGPCRRVQLDCCGTRNACFRNVIESVRTSHACPFCKCVFK